MSPFASNLRILRRREGLTRPQLTAKLEFGTNVLQCYESGKVEPTLPRMCKIADYFGVSLDWLAGRKAPQSDAQKIMNALSKIYHEVKRIEEKE